MAIELKLDLSKFLRDLDATAEDIGDGARRGLEDVMDEWKRKSIDVAPLDAGTLRRSIDTDIDGQGIELTGEITAVAVEVSKGKRFNYAYYLHEVYPEMRFGNKNRFENPSTPGTIPKYLDTPAKDNEEKWMRKIEKEIEKEVKRRGW